MLCKKCKTRMRVANMFKANGSVITQRLVCDRCLSVCTSITFLVNEDPPRGQGAYSLSKALDDPKKLKSLRDAIEQSQ